MGISLIPELKGLAAPAALMFRHLRLLDVTGLHVMVEIVGEEATIVIKTKGLGACQGRTGGRRRV